MTSPTRILVWYCSSKVWAKTALKVMSRYPVSTDQMESSMLLISAERLCSEAWSSVSSRCRSVMSSTMPS